MDFKSLLVTCSVHPEILRALHFKTNHPSWSSAWSDKRLCQTTGLAAGGDAGESADKCRTACGLSSQHSSRTVADSSWYMHVKSGLLQLWEITTCSKGYTTRLLFLSISTAHLIHGQVYSARENSNSENLSGSLKLFPKLTGKTASRLLGCVFTAWTTSPPSHSLPLWFPPSLFFCLRDSRGSCPLTRTTPSRIRISAPCFPCHYHSTSAWTLIFLFSCYRMRTQKCCGLLSQQLRGQRRKHSNSQLIFTVTLYRRCRATPISCTTHQSCYFEVIPCSGILWLALISPEGFQQGN